MITTQSEMIMVLASHDKTIPFSTDRKTEIKLIERMAQKNPYIEVWEASGKTFAYLLDSRSVTP